MRIAHELLTKLRAARRVPARLVGVRLSGLARNTGQLPLELPAGGALDESAQDRGLARAVDGVRRKFGPTSILPGAITRDPLP
jgi:hypothetical protein